MKKPVPYAFGILLFILSIISFLFPNSEITVNIVYAVILPSFLLSAISFVSEFSDFCASYATHQEASAIEGVRIAAENIRLVSECTRQGILPIVLEEATQNQHNQKVQERLTEFSDMSLAAGNIKVQFNNVKKVCGIITIVCYVGLFLSLIFASIFVKILSEINLNSITLFSLTIMYLSIELKKDFFFFLYNCIYKKEKKDIANSTSTK